jgi:hypothetical protein
MALIDLLEDRHLHGTYIDRKGAAGVKPAALRRIDWAWDITFKNNSVGNTSSVG